MKPTFPSTFFFINSSITLRGDVMPRKNPIPEREKIIAARLRKFRRLHLGLSQAAAARKLGIDSTRLASYELGRVPLRFGFVEQFCRTFGLSQVWLAEGTSKMTDYWPVSESVLARVPESALFTHAYDEILRPAWKETVDFGAFCMAAILGRGPKDKVVLPEGTDPEFYLNQSIEYLREEFSDCPKNLKGELLGVVVRAIASFARQHIDEFEAIRAQNERAKARISSKARR